MQGDIVNIQTNQKPNKPNKPKTKQTQKEAAHRKSLCAVFFLPGNEFCFLLRAAHDGVILESAQKTAVKGEVFWQLFFHSYMMQEIFMTKKDWYEAGEQIRNLVQEAIDNEDFSQLSSTVTNVVNDTMSGLEKALKDSLGNGSRQAGSEAGAETDSSRARNRAEDARYSGGQNAQDQMGDQRGTAGANRGDRTRSESEDTYRKHRPYQEWTRQTRQEAADRIRVNVEKACRTKYTEHVQKKNTALVPVRAPGQISGAVMKWTGYACSGTFGLSLAILGVVGAATGIALTVPISILGVLFAGSLALGIGGKKRSELAQRFRKYVNVLGNRTYCMVEELADSVGESSKFVRKDLKKMIRQGFFPQGYLDQKETCLITDKQTYQQYQDAQQSYEARQKTAQQSKESGTQEAGGKLHSEDGLASERKAGSENASANRGGAGFDGGIRSDLDPKCAELIAQGKSYIRHIHECNDRILDEAMSEKLARLELVVTRIFTEAERNPEVVDDLKKMMSYYLPTTKKLLDAYCNLNEQPVGGQNIDSMKKEIEGTLDTLNAAFEKLLDDLFEEQAWDISSDISVLNTMLAQEGLTGNQFERRRNL